jgi:hypothetical protein
VTGEAACRAVILGRTGTTCEGCRSAAWTYKAHRVARSAGGRWAPANVLGLCRGCHGWAHHNPVHAQVAGWALPGGTDPVLAPVFLASATLTPGWYRLNERGEPHDAGMHALTPGFLPPHFPRGLLPPPRITVAP